MSGAGRFLPGHDKRCRALTGPGDAAGAIVGVGAPAVHPSVGRRKLVIPPHLAYGDRSPSLAIKPGETLVSVVDLLAVN